VKTHGYENGEKPLQTVLKSAKITEIMASNHRPVYLSLSCWFYLQNVNFKQHNCSSWFPTPERGKKYILRWRHGDIWSQ